VTRVYSSDVVELIESVAGRHWIAGRAVAGNSDVMPVLDPGTGLPIGEVPVANAALVAESVGAARAALRGAWRTVSPAGRGTILRRVADLLRQQAETIGALETINSGKPLRDGRGEALAAAAYFDYYAGAADKIEGTTVPQPAGVLSMVLKEPIGVSAQILPSNYPLGTAARGFAPALAAGCTIVAKPADETPLTALVLARLLADAGLPDGVVNIVTGTGGVTGAALAEADGIDQITFTGSLATGQRILAASTRNMVPAALELGGKSPLVVLDDADLDAAAATVTKHVFTHAGQVCSASSRLVAVRDIVEPLLARVAARTRDLTVGHGLDDCSLGAIASSRQRDRIARTIAEAKASGARLIAGGEVAEVQGHADGFYYRPTVMQLDDPLSPAATEELFGPVLTVLVAESAEHALELANAGPYGLVAGVFTANLDQALRFVTGIDAGQVYVNDWHLGGVQAPFGGVKRSGFGRERGLAAIEKYVRLKSASLRFALPSN
jgi:aldehyde dehydrogenase (NAD+)